MKATVSPEHARLPVAPGPSLPPTSPGHPEAAFEELIPSDLSDRALASRLLDGSPAGVSRGQEV